MIRSMLGVRPAWTRAVPQLKPIYALAFTQMGRAVPMRAVPGGNIFIRHYGECNCGNNGLPNDKNQTNHAATSKATEYSSHLRKREIRLPPIQFRPQDFALVRPRATKIMPAPTSFTNNQQARRNNTLEHHLKQVQGWWGRLAVRAKWALIKNYRPFNWDELGALFSWIIWGHILWILLGTTTFISLVVWAISQTRTQDTFARYVGRLVTKETGLRVVFEQAIVPDWKAGAIVFRKVFIQRRPGAVSRVATGSQAQALSSRAAAPITTEDDGNYTQFDLTVDQISVTLSLKRWLAGRGLLETVEARGVRGVVDRRYVKFDPLLDPQTQRKKHKRGDFDWETTKIEDLVVTVLQPDHTKASLQYATQVKALRDQGLLPNEIQTRMRRFLASAEAETPELGPHAGLAPFEFCLFNCELSKLRKQWLFFDMLNANYLSGSFDGAMFSMHTRQLPTDTSAPSFRRSLRSPAPNPSFKKVQRFRIDNVAVKHLNRGAAGMFGWIESGSVDFLADIMLPEHDIELTTTEELKDLLERWRAQAKQIWSHGTPGEIITEVERKVKKREAQKTITIDLRVQFNNPRASPPLYTPDLTYLNNAIIHPMVAYINSRDTYIPVHCHVAKRLYDFDGSWTVYDSGLMADLSSEIHRAFSRNAQDDEERSRRIKKVGFWSLQFMAQLVLLTLGIVA